MIVASGFKVWPREVEDVLASAEVESSGQGFADHC